MDAAEKKRLRNRERYHANIEAERARSRAYAIAHPEKARERMRRYIAKHRIEIRDAKRARYHADAEFREQQKAAANAWNKAHLMHCREKQRRFKKLPTPTRPEPAMCEICKLPNKRALHLDHDHTTGTFRGWLCGPCNRALGMMKDSPKTLRRAADYLEAYTKT